MKIRLHLFTGLLLCANLLLPVTSRAGGTLDEILAAENKARQVEEQAVELVDDLGFARRVCLDLTGRIPTGKEIVAYLKWPAEERRGKLIAQYMSDSGFADRWSAFFADMLRVRSNKEGGTELLAYVHNAIETGLPYDEMCRRMISVNGKEGRTPEIGFVLGDDADPMVLASATAQVFMGIRISCAQCHDHPFDRWTREDFYGVAAFFGKTRRQQNRLTNTVFTTEAKDTTVMWPPEDESEPDERSPMKPTFPFPYLDESENLAFLERLEELCAAKAASESKAKGPSVDDLIASAGSKTRSRLKSGNGGTLKVAMEAKSDIRKIDVNADLYRRSDLRNQLASLVTSPRNRYFARALVNRVWKDLVGTGFVDPVDDFREDNLPSHPRMMDYLAEEFVANGFDFRWLVREIVSSDVYGRAHVPLDADENQRYELESNFLATPMRRMKAEAMFDSIVTAGHLFDVKHRPGQNPRLIQRRVRVAVESSEQGDDDSQTAIEADDEPMMESMEGEMLASAENYGLEQAIAVDFKALLMPKDDAPVVDSMRKMTREEIEAMRDREMPRRQPGTKYVTKMVEQTIDDNPMFSSAYRMATPAPAGHFLRLFGQPSRVDLGEDRIENASMRQSLMMLNGKLTHEAARVGELEPVYAMLVGPEKDLRRAIRYTYFEILTRLPNDAEIAEAVEIIAEGKSVLDGMADLRWVLLNSNEFRFVP